jgi:UDP-3-O-[3-hydroxymyristoyl] glucosamine N-acyltransferase
MSWTTGRVARLVGAQCEGSEDILLHSVSALDQAGPGDLAFCTGGRWREALARTGAAAVLVNQGDVPQGCVALRHDNPRLAYAQAAAAMVPLFWPEPGTDERAAVHADASVHPTATVGPFAVIERGAHVGQGSWVMAHAYVGADTVVGKRCRIFPHAVVMERCSVGDRVWLHPGAIVGADGFGQVVTADGPVRVPQLGTVQLADDVEIGANACVDRAALDVTRIGPGSRLDNLVQVAHGVTIGARCLLAAFAGVAGGAKLGDDVVMAGRTAVIDGIEVGDGAVFAGLASASKRVPAGRRIGGSPARAYVQWLREVAAIQRLPRALRRLDRVEQRLTEMEER